MVHSVNDFIRSELPAWKSDMAVKEIGKRRKCDRNWEPFYTKITDINEQEFDQTRTSNPNIQKPDVASVILVQTVLHRIILFNPGVSEFYWWWCEQTSVRIIYIYVLPILQPTLISYNTVKHIIRICKFVAKQPNEKKIHMKQHTVDPRWLREAKPTSKPHEIHQTTPIGTCSQGREKKQNNLEMACWNHPNLIPHTVLFISILQRFASTCFDIL